MILQFERYVEASFFEAGFFHAVQIMYIQAIIQVRLKYLEVV